jgi:hypothetical protein
MLVSLEGSLNFLVGFTQKAVRRLSSQRKLLITHSDTRSWILAGFTLKKQRAQKGRSTKKLILAKRS